MVILKRLDEFEFGHGLVGSGQKTRPGESVRIYGRAAAKVGCQRLDLSGNMRLLLIGKKGVSQPGIWRTWQANLNDFGFLTALCFETNPALGLAIWLRLADQLANECPPVQQTCISGHLETKQGLTAKIP